MLFAKFAKAFLLYGMCVSIVKYLLWIDITFHSRHDLHLHNSFSLNYNIIHVQYCMYSEWWCQWCSYQWNQQKLRYSNRAVRLYHIAQIFENEILEICNVICHFPLKLYI